MAVDSNVITFARIKEELYQGKSLTYAFKEGTKSSFSAILDSNLTTLIVAVIMFIFGESSIKGFATMLIITVLVTMFTMVFLTRILLKLFVHSNYFHDKLNLFIHVLKKDIPDVSKNEKVIKVPFSKVNFLKHGNLCVMISLIILFLGAVFFGFRGLNLGIDYQAGTDITISTQSKVSQKQINQDLKKLKLKKSSLSLSNDSIDILV